MAIPNWTGAIDGDWEKVGNWSTGVLPVDGDSVHVLPTATNDMTTNLDRTGDTAGAGLDLALFDAHEDSTVNIGTSGSPLKLAADKLIHRGRGLLYFESDDGTGGLTTDRVIIDSDIGAVITQAGAAITALECLRGRTDVTVSAAMGRLFVVRGLRGPAPTVNIDGTAVITIFAHSAGTVNYSSSGATLVLSLSGGVFSYTSPGADITQVYQTGGTLELRGPGSIGDVYWLHGGTLDTTLTSGLKTIAKLYVSPTANEVSSDETLTATVRVDIGE